MNAATEALTELHKRILAEADEQDGHAQGEILAGNIVKEQACRSAAAGLRMAAGMVTEELENQKTCERIDAMTPAEIEAELLTAGYTKERLAAGLVKVRATCEAALARKAVVHGVSCHKWPHRSTGGYEHDANDDGPYDVDRVSYCGRCHHCLP